MKSVFNEPSTDFHLKLNEQSFHIPIELLKRNIKHLNTLIGNVSADIHNKFQECNKLLELNSSSHDKLALATLNETIKAIDHFEKKLHKLVNEEGQILNRIKLRIEFFQDLEKAKASQNETQLASWYQRYTNVLIGDYLTRNSSVHDKSIHQDVNTDFKDEDFIWNTGTFFLKQQHLENLFDYDILIRANKISRALIEDHNLKPLINWIHENRTYLSQNACRLNFDSRLQEYIQLLKFDKYDEAITCFQTYLIQFISTNMEDIQKAAGLLLFYKFKNSPLKKDNNNSSILMIPTKEPLSNYPHEQLFNSMDNIFSHFFHRELPISLKTMTSDNEVLNISQLIEIPKSSIYSTLFDERRWSSLSEVFLKEYYKLYGISQNDPLLIYLSLGISTLKTKDCLHVKEMKDSESENLNDFIKSQAIINKCPICSPEFTEISQTLPYAHHTKSVLFENPVMLPNGNVYDMNKLLKLAETIRENKIVNLEQTEIIDPIDKQIYAIKSFIKMYPT